MSWHDAWIFIFGLCVGLLFHFWKSYWGQRGTKSGEIDAIQAKIDLVLSQQKLSTILTEGIRAEFLEKGSAKERLREMRKEVSFRLVDTLAELEDIAGQAIDQAFVYAMPEAFSLDSSDSGAYHKKRDEITLPYEARLRTMVQLCGHVGLVFDSAARDATQKVYNAADAILRQTNRFQYEPKNSNKLLELFKDRSREVHELIREQLLA